MKASSAILLTLFFGSGDFSHLSKKKKIIYKNYDLLHLEAAVNETLKVVPPLGLVIWPLNKSNLNFALSDRLIKQFSKQVPTSLATEPLMIWNTLEKSIECFKKIHIFFIRSDEIDNVEVVLGQIEPLSSLSKPKVLIFHFTSKKSPVRQIDCQNLLKNYWEGQDYLDLTIIFISEKAKPTVEMLYYNPFSRKFINRKNVSSLFPSKVENMMGYNFSIAVHNDSYRPDRKFARIYWGFAAVLPEIDELTKNFFCPFHNCSVVRVFLVDGYNDTFNEILPDLIYSKMDLFFTNDSDITYGLSFLFHSIIAVIPHHSALLEKNQHMNSFNYTNLVLFTTFLALSTLISMLLIRIWKFDSRIWNVLDVFLCILGSPLNVSLAYKERIFYLALIFISMYANNDMLDIATEYEFDVISESVEFLEQLEKLNLAVFSTTNGLLVQNEYFHKKSKHVAWKDLESHLQNVLDKGDRIVVSDERLIHQYSAWFKKKYGKGLRKTKFFMNTGYAGFKYHRGSPYVSVYNDLILHSLGAGLIKVMTSKDFVHFINCDFDDEDYDIIGSNELDYYYLLLRCTFFMYIFATLVFLAELFAKKFYLSLKILIYEVWMKLIFRFRRTETDLTGRIP